MTRHLIRTAALAALAAGGALPAAAQEEGPYQFSVITQTGVDNTFWQSIKRGMDDACTAVGADCQLIFAQENGNLQQQLQNFETAVAQGVDGIALVIVDDTLFDEPVARAMEAGVPVVTLNVDDTEGGDGNERLAFVGQDLFQAGYDLMEGIYGMLDTSQPQHVLLGLARPGESWAEQRIGGARLFLEEQKAANPDLQLTWEVIDSANDLSVTGQRICQYVQANPQTTAYIDSGFWLAGAGECLRDLGIEPNQIMMGGFDLVPILLDEMERGYVHLTVDQQPYLQGYLPILQLDLMNRYGLSAWDVNTGKALVRPEDVAQVREFVDLGVR
jgi:simple sugar transport system substrate-binding protein